MKNYQGNQWKWVAGLAMTLILCSGFFMNSYAVDSQITIFYQNMPVETEVAPVIESGRTLVPIATIAEVMGAEVKWHGATRQVEINADGTNLMLTLNSANVKVTKNGQSQTIKLDVPAMAIQGRTMVPLAFIATYLDHEVVWVNEYKMVLIDSDFDIIMNSSEEGPYEEPALELTPENKADIKVVVAAIKNSPKYSKDGNLEDLMELFYPEGEDVDLMPGVAELREKFNGYYLSYGYGNEMEYNLFLLNKTTKKVYNLDSDTLKFYEYPSGTMVLDVKNVSDSDVLRTPKPFINITEENAGPETLKILSKLGRLPLPVNNYTATVEGYDDSITEGYIVAIRSKSADGMTEPVIGRFIIQLDAGKILAYDIYEDYYYYIYGTQTAMGK